MTCKVGGVNSGNFFEAQTLSNFFAEIEALNENLDDLNSVLDTIEQRADDMKTRLLELLMSNREIMKCLREEGEGSADKCNHHPGKPADEA